MDTRFPPRPILHRNAARLPFSADRRALEYWIERSLAVAYVVGPEETLPRELLDLLPDA